MPKPIIRHVKVVRRELDFGVAKRVTVIAPVFIKGM